MYEEFIDTSACFARVMTRNVVFVVLCLSIDPYNNVIAIKSLYSVGTFQTPANGSAMLQCAADLKRRRDIAGDISAEPVGVLIVCENCQLLQ